MAKRPAPAHFFFARGERKVFPFAATQNIVWRQHTQVNPDVFVNVNIPFQFLNLILPGVIGQIAYGKYLSPQYRVDPELFIPAIGTRTGIPQVQNMEEIYFTLYLPSGTPPATGWPVAILGIGGASNKDSGTLLLVNYLAK